MKPYRVILANQPRLLRSLLRRVLRNTGDIDVVGEITDLENLPPQVEQTDAQWVIVSMWRNNDFPETLHSLTVEHPALCLLGLAADGSQVIVRCPGAAEVAVSNPSLESLFAALRTWGSGNGSLPKALR
jgi:DNA-binding NarL/FixJ family response regulator